MDSLQNYVHYPDIIGDGDVTSLVMPNGSFQYIFIPSFKRDSWPPYTLSPNVQNPYCNLNMEAWLVRNVSNPLPSYVCNQQLPRVNTDPQICRAPYDFRFDTPALGYLNKFHLDQYTSTTDLHYFCPSVRSNQFEKSSAWVQVDTPLRNIVHTYEFVCNKPCCCKNNNNTGDNNYTFKCMSVDNLQESTQTSSVTKVNCQCSAQKCTSNKIMTTYNDQACGSQTIDIQNNLSTKKKESTDGIPKTYKFRRLRGKTSPIKLIGVCEKSSCCCNTTEEET